MVISSSGSPADSACQYDSPSLVMPMFALPVRIHTCRGQNPYVSRFRIHTCRGQNPYVSLQATRKGWPYYIRCPGPGACATDASCRVGPSLAGGLGVWLTGGGVAACPGTRFVSKGTPYAG